MQVRPPSRLATAVTALTAPATTLARELRTAGRTLFRNPGFALPVVLVLALGISATTGVVRLAGALLLADPPVAEPDRLAWLIRHDMDDSAFSIPEGREYERRSGVFDGLALYQSLGADLGGTEDASRVGVEVVSGDYFRVLGLRPSHGRLLEPADDGAPGSGRSAVVSTGLARRLWGSPAAALDRRLELNRETFTVVGVAPETFRGLSFDLDAELWVPLSASDAVALFFPDPADAHRHGMRWLRAVGRLPEGVPLARAQEQVDAAARGMAEDFPETNQEDDRFLLHRVSDGNPIVREAALPRLGLVLATALVILLVAGTNTANLLLARAAARQHEMGVRRALGAGRTGLVRHLFGEALLLFAGGGLVGFLGALWAGPLLTPALPPGIDAEAFRQPDPEVALFAVLLTLAIALLFGLVPALRSTRRGRLPGLNAPSATPGRGGQRTQAALVVTQVALSALLLVTSVLLLRALVESYRVDLGYETGGVAMATVEPARLGHGAEETAVLRRQLERRLAEHPALAASAVVYPPPLAGGWIRSTVQPEGYEPAEGEDMNVHVTATSPGLFRTLHLPFLAGVPMAGTVGAGAPAEAVVNRALASRFWGGPEAALGRFLELGPERRLRVAGVVEDARFTGPHTAPHPRVFLAPELFPTSSFVVLARSAAPAAAPKSLRPGAGDGETAAALEVVRATLRGLAPEIPLHGAAPLDRSLGRLLAPQRRLALLLAVVAALAVAVAAVGLYGLLSFGVRRRLRELGIRVALGAEPGHLVRAVVGRGLALSAAGVVAGLTAAAFLGRLLQGHLFAVEPTDPVSFLVVAAVLLAVAGAASLAPAGVATRADPVQVLRQQ